MVKSGNLVTANASTLGSINQVNPIYVTFSIGEQKYLYVTKPIEKSEDELDDIELKFIQLDRTTYSAKGHIVFVVKNSTRILIPSNLKHNSITKHKSYAPTSSEEFVYPPICIKMHLYYQFQPSSKYRTSRDHGMEIEDAALEAATLRLLSILTTSFAFFLCVFPLIVAFGACAASRQTSSWNKRILWNGNSNIAWNILYSLFVCIHPENCRKDKFP